jgi:membrane protein
MTYSPILLQELGMPTGAVGTVLFFSTIVELPVILFSYKFMDRFSGRTLMLLAFAIMVAQFLLYATAPNAFVAVVTMLVLRAVGSTLFGMILLKIVRGVVQVRSVSTALGVISATDAMSAILMQNLGGILVENTSIRILYFAMAGLMMLGMILTLFLRVQNTEKVFS